MLLITKRWRNVGGFIAGGSVFALLSLLLVGWGGLLGYVRMLRMFSTLKATGARQAMMEIDLYSTLLTLTNNQRALTVSLFAIIGSVMAVLLARAWRRDPIEAWSTAITWTLVLNFYLLIYDATLVIIPVLLTASVTLRSREIDYGLRLILLAIFLTPFLVHYFSVQPLTLALLGFGCYQLWRGHQINAWSFNVQCS
jgi:hypothetical protein